jgi:hypothetical protein
MLVRTVMFNKDNIKMLEIINQNCKYLFDKYIILSSKIIIGFYDNKSLNKGIHYAGLMNGCFDDFQLINLDPLYIVFNANHIFQIFKTTKKSDLQTYSVIINQSGITCLSSPKLETPLIIGESITLSSDDECNYLKELEVFDVEGESIVISESTIGDLLNNKVRILEYAKYKIRITKELLPNLKKDDTVAINMINLKNNLIKIRFTIFKNKTNMMTYHIYTAINYYE